MKRSGIKGFIPTFSPSSKKDWANRLQSAVTDLSDLNTSTETEFLSLGERLQDFLLRTQEISNLSSSIAGRMNGEEINQAQQGLQEIFTRIEHLNSKSRQGTEILTAIIEITEGIKNHLGTFERVVKNLYVLSNFIKIETARIKSGEQDFGSLVEDIKSLASHIEKKSIHLFDQAHSLGILIRENLAKLRSFETRQQGQTQRILDEAMKNLVSLTGRHELSSRTLNTLTNEWDHISRSIGEVVGAIQFHDITRQQIEHAEGALNGLIDKLVLLGTANGSAGFLYKFRKRPAVASEEMALSRQEAAGRSVATGKLQIAQLHYAGDELFSAVDRIIRNLRAIAGHAGKMCEEARQVTGMDEQAGHSFLTEMEKGLSGLSSALADYAGLNHEMKATTGQVAETVAEMRSFVKDIEKIGIEMKMVALNTIIHAAHLGEEGLPLSVLAESIHHLSVDTGDQINTISGNLKNVISVSGQLTRNVQGEEGKEWTEVDSLADHIGGLIAPVRNMSDDIEQLLVRISDLGKVFTEDIEKTIQQVTVHQRVNQGIKEVNSRLESIVAEIGATLPENLRLEQSRELEELSRHYTMNHEREIHQSLFLADFSAQPPKSPDPASDPEQADRKSQSKKEDDFGDNVDLF